MTQNPCNAFDAPVFNHNPDNRKMRGRKPKNCGAEKTNSLVSIDFSGHADLLQKIRDCARDELRTVENQIIYYLKSLGVK